MYAETVTWTTIPGFASLTNTETLRNADQKTKGPRRALHVLRRKYVHPIPLRRKSISALDDWPHELSERRSLDGTNLRALPRRMQSDTETTGKNRGDGTPPPSMSRRTVFSATLLSASAPHASCRSVACAARLVGRGLQRCDAGGAPCIRGGTRSVRCRGGTNRARTKHSADIWTRHRPPSAPRSRALPLLVHQGSRRRDAAVGEPALHEVERYA